MNTNMPLQLHKVFISVKTNTDRQQRDDADGNSWLGLGPEYSLKRHSCAGWMEFLLHFATSCLGGQFSFYIIYESMPCPVMQAIT